MRFDFKTSLVSILLASLAVSAQYYSLGWQPGQPQVSSTPTFYTQALPSPTPTSTSASKSFTYSSLLNFNLWETFTSITGINFAQNEDDLWGSRVPLITDENFDTFITNETLSDEEEKDRVWILEVFVLFM